MKKKTETLDIADVLRGVPAYDRLRERCAAPGATEVLGLSAEGRLLTVLALFHSGCRKIVWITRDEDRAKKLRQRLQPLIDRSQLGAYPLRELLPYDVAGYNQRLTLERLRVLAGLGGSEPFLAILPCEALPRLLQPPRISREASLRVRVGDRLDVGELCHHLAELGYERLPLTEEPGSFSQRGSVVDVFPPGAEQPCRLDFFDDEVESLRVFDPERQISVGDAEEALITPASECVLSGQQTERLADEMERAGSEAAVKLRGEEKKHCLDRWQRRAGELREGLRGEAMEHWLPLAYPRLAGFEEYLPEGTLLLLDEGEDIAQKLREFEAERLQILSELVQQGELLASYEQNFRSPELLWHSLGCRPCLIFSFLQTPLPLDVEERIHWPLREFSFARPREERGRELAELAAGCPVVLCAGEQPQLDAMAAFAATWEAAPVRCCRLPLEKSLELTEPPLRLIAKNDLIGFELPGTAKKPRKKGRALDSFIDLKPGDYVVHESHGIGQYMGVERLRVGEIERDYLHIRYQGQDKLYIPTDQMDLLQKYIGNGEAAPRVNKLGTRDWQRTKERVRTSVQDMAEELIKLYAQRAAQKGFAFTPDSPWQREMENDFPFEETPDQLEAIEEVKADMEAERPMDRLLCGDVGYGKTEVALRAAFKAVLDGKQVAILVPTTILCQQHERTFRARLEKFGARIGALSRFKSKKEIDETLALLENGQLDLIIGTHMLLGKRVHFRDLGLLVIDEEQRFGVAHKEKIKQLKQNVDVLAMSATPIPRTLHMSLLGVRDISIIETPPPCRQPVQTYVMERRKRVIREAITRELGREGQLYFIHNRIDTIGKVEDELRELAPEARVLVGHGQMPEGELEQVMTHFMAGEADILLSTTIVESGLDFPNVNTLIVDQSDHLGLSQLYQLRGRVGRSPRQAYAYFFYPGGKLLELPARKRLAAIRDYTDLGSGFKIALRDMEIRGAGNILGAEQHGHMLSVGFEMYCRLIDEQVHTLKGEPAPAPPASVNLDLAVSAFLPEDYIGDAEIKLEFYKKIAEVRSRRELKELSEEMEDRFGSIPDSVYNLFLTCRLKLAAERLGITTINQQNSGFTVTFKELNSVSGEALAELTREFGRRFSFQMGQTLAMTVRTVNLDDVKALAFLIKILDALIKRENAKRV